jgi:hypothetical protein
MIFAEQVIESNAEMAQPITLEWIQYARAR